MPLRPLSYNQIKRLLSACSSVLEKKLGVAAVARGVTRTSKIDSRDPVLVGARFNGDVMGQVLLGLSESSACGMAERLHKRMWQETVQFTQVDHEVNEILREFANMLFNEIVQSFQVADILCTVEASEITGVLEWRKEGQELLIAPFSLGAVGFMNVFLSLSVDMERENTGKRIMIVDDSAAMRAMMRNILEDAGYLVVGEAANGREAVATVPALSPDLVTMDIEMPEINGVQALAAIKVSSPHVKIIMVTSLADRGKVLDCLGKGAANYILKPYEPDRVLEAVARALG